MSWWIHSIILRRSRSGLRWGKLECSGPFLLVCAALFYLDQENVLLWVALAAILHESGHYAAAVLAGGRVRRVRAALTGCCMELDPRQPLSYGGEMAVILSGPAVDLILAGAAAQLGAWWEPLYLFAGINLALGVFNLLPVYPLDGGRLARLILTAFLTPDRAVAAVQLCSSGLAALYLTVQGILLLQGRGSPAFLIFGGWLLAGAASGEWV